MSKSRAAAVLGVLGSLIVVAADLVLVLVVTSQNPDQQFPARALFVAIYLGLISLTALAGSVQLWRGRSVGRALLVAPAINLALVGVPAIFTIGYLLLLAALLMLGAGVIGGRPPFRITVVLALVGATSLGGGFYLTR